MILLPNKAIYLKLSIYLLAGHKWPTYWGQLRLNYNKVEVHLKFTKYKISFNSIHSKSSIYNLITLRIIKY